MTRDLKTLQEIKTHIGWILLCGILLSVGGLAAATISILTGDSVRMMLFMILAIVGYWIALPNWRTWMQASRAIKELDPFRDPEQKNP